MPSRHAPGRCVLFTFHHEFQCLPVSQMVTLLDRLYCLIELLKPTPIPFSLSAPLRPRFRKLNLENPAHAQQRAPKQGQPCSVCLRCRSGGTIARVFSRIVAPLLPHGRAHNVTGVSDKQLFALERRHPKTREAGAARWAWQAHPYRCGVGVWEPQSPPRHRRISAVGAGRAGRRW